MNGLTQLISERFAICLALAALNGPWYRLKRLIARIDDATQVRSDPPLEHEMGIIGRSGVPTGGPSRISISAPAVPAQHIYNTLKQRVASQFGNSMTAYQQTKSLFSAAYGQPSKSIAAAHSSQYISRTPQLAALAEARDALWQLRGAKQEHDRLNAAYDALTQHYPLEALALL